MTLTRKQEKAMFAKKNADNYREEHLFLNKKECEAEYGKCPKPNSKPKSQNPHEFQNNNQERIIHGKWKETDTGSLEFRYILEGTGDIFRELAKYPDGWFAKDYIHEKASRLQRHLNERNLGKVHPDDSYELTHKQNKLNFARMIRMWSKQPTTSKLQEKAVMLNLALLHGRFEETQRRLTSLMKDLKIKL